MSIDAQSHIPGSSCMRGSAARINTQVILKEQLTGLYAHYATVGTTYAYINQASTKPADGNAR